MKIIKKDLIQALKKYKDISYILPIVISFLFSISQILGYYFKIGYLSYFGISKEFYNFNLFNDLIPVILNFFIISVMVIIIFISANIMHSFFKNAFNKVLEGIDLKNIININNLTASLTLLFKNIKENIKKNYTSSDILIIFIGLYILILLSLEFFSFIMYGSIYNLISDSIFLYFISLICSLIYTIIFKIKYKKGNNVKEQENKSYVEYLFELIILLLIILMYFQNLGISAAKAQREFSVIDNKYILLYNSDDKYLVADFKYVDPNNLIINTKNIKIIDINNHIVEKHVFNNVIRE